MKTRIFFFLFLFAFVSPLAIAQEQVSVVSMGFEDQSERSFWVRGEGSQHFLNHLFESKKNTKRRGYVHRFKHVNVPGIKGKVSLKVHEGIHGKRHQGSCTESYFRTFTSEKYKQKLTRNMTKDEQPGIIIYLKKEGKHPHTTDVERNAFVQYIRTYCCS